MGVGTLDVELRAQPLPFELSCFAPHFPYVSVQRVLGRQRQDWFHSGLGHVFTKLPIESPLIDDFPPLGTSSFRFDQRLEVQVLEDSLQNLRWKIVQSDRRVCFFTRDAI